MSPDRRAELLAWAAQENAWIVEDECYFGQPLQALQSMDRSGCVIYLGTFTKMLFNSLRLGFLVVPERVADSFATARTVLDRHPPTLEQAILAEFILGGHFGHHVRRMRQIYAQRSVTLCEAAQQRLPGRLEVVRPDSGMRTIAWVRTGQRDAWVAERARALGLEVVALSDFTIRHFHHNPWCSDLPVAPPPN